MSELRSQPEFQSDSGKLNLRDLFYKYIRFLPLFILTLAIALLGSYLYLRYAPRSYQSSGILVIKSETGNARPGDKFQEYFQSDQKMNIQNEMEVLRSKALMTRVVRKLGLEYTYYVIGKIRTINAYKATPFQVVADTLYDPKGSFDLSLKVNKERQFKVNNDPALYGFGQPIRIPQGIIRLVEDPGNPYSAEYRVEYRSAESMGAFYASKIKVIPKMVGTGILNITAQTGNAFLCKQLVDMLMSEYGAYSLELKNQASDQMIAFIDGRMEVINRELDSVTNNLLGYMQRNNVLDIDLQKERNLTRVNESDKQLNELLYQRNTAALVEDYLRDVRNRNGIIVMPSSIGLAEPVLNGLVTNYNALQVKRKELLDGNVPVKNPVIVELDAQVVELRENILGNLGKLRASLERNISSLRQAAGLASNELRDLPAKDRELAELKKAVENKQLLYNILVEKREQTAISRASSIAGSQIIELAAYAPTPVKPNRRNIQLLAIVAGLALPALFIFLSELMNDKILTREDVSKITTAPILGEIGHSHHRDVLIMHARNRTMIAEQFRIIRSNMQYVVEKAERFTVMVTSTFSGEGKSFASTNIGAVMAISGRKTVILEFDIRKPKLLSGLSMEKGPGITNFLIGRAELKDLARPVPDMENLYVIGCGPVPPNPGELLLTPRMDALFDWLRKEFEVIVIDTAPVGMVSDAQTLAKYADATLYLVRQQYTYKKQVSLIDEFYQSGKLPKVSVLINDVKIKFGYGYYGYGRYGYGYGYGYGYKSEYYEEENPTGSSSRSSRNPLNWFRRGRRS
ncbi:MAG: hypothetical protein RJA57_1888 [Bacteroidota bacterium]